MSVTTIPFQNIYQGKKLLFNSFPSKNKCMIILLEIIKTSSGSMYSSKSGPMKLLNVELDVEKKIQAEVLKDRIRIKQFFIDFDRLRKGFVGEAGVIQFNPCSP